MQKTVLLSKIKDNPFRDKKRNPIDQDKVESIAESIETTKEFWRGVYGRETEDGYVEIAFGHHRVDAARMAGLTEIRVELEKFSDGDMLMWMARENVQGSLPIMMEAISAAVKALAEGKIELPELSKDTKKAYIRYAPSFIAGAPGPTVGARAYTLWSLTKFLGGNYYKQKKKEPKDSAVAAMARLEAEERGWLKNVKKEHLDSLGVHATIQHIGDIARIEKTKEKSVREIQEAERAAIEEKRKLETEQKEETKKLEAKRQEALNKAAQARIENNKREVARQKQRADDLAEKAKEKEVIDSIKISVIDAKVAETKKKQEEAQKAAEYSFVKRDVDCFLGNLESTQAGLFTENVKALSKRNLSLKDRQRVWEALSAFSDWVGGWAAAQFVASGVPKYKKKK